jgi:hypothetical protein
MMASIPPVNDHFANKHPAVHALHDQLLNTVNKFGPVEQDPRKTSIPINRNSALVGVGTRKDYLRFTIKADHQINNPSIEKMQRISAHRFYHMVRIDSPKDFDAELKSWLKHAYALAE